MSYVVGVSSGFFSVAEPRERIELLGIFKKAQSSITKGVSFVQIDLESLAEFEEENLKEKMQREIREKLGVRYGIHSETRAAGVMAAELDSAIKMEYDRAHRRIVEILKKSKEIGSVYVLIHSSESTPFPLLERELQACDLVDVDGNPLSEFIQKNPWVFEWIFGASIKKLVEVAIETWKEKEKSIKAEDLDKKFSANGIFPKDFIFREIWHGTKLSEQLVAHIISVIHDFELRTIPARKYEEFTDAEKMGAISHLEMRVETLIKRLQEHLTDYVQSKALHYGPERLAYYIMAKHMERSKDPLWEKIVKAAIKFFARRDGMSEQEWLKKKGIKKLSIDDENFRKAHELWVPAVSARYIYGHFFPKRPEYEDPKKYLDGMFFALESPMGGRGVEEWPRLSNPLLYYYLVEEVNEKVGKNIFAVALDFEHMLSSRIDPELVAELWPEGKGKHIRIIHAGWPATLAPAHMPIYLGSDQQYYLYRVYYKLREKGFGVEDECYLIFERGGPETFQESILSLKKIAEFLEKDVPPDNLPLEEFAGISPTDVKAMERQLATIREHAYDPLKGLLMVPEEMHGALGGEAVRRGKAEEWRKEKYR